MYCGHTCALIAVDIDATAQAFIQLFSSDQLRQAMGEEGRKRATQEFDWKIIIPRYENLWAELNQLRNVEFDKTNSVINKPASWPARMDPFESFASYPSFNATEKTRFKLADENQHIALDRYKSFLNLAMVNYAKYLIPTQDEISKILSYLTSGSKSMAEVAALFSNDRQAWIARSLIWLLKIGVLKLDV
jgi:starch synthase